MTNYDQHWLIGSVARDRIRVAKYGEWDGRGPTRYFERCRATHQPTGTFMIFSRDAGHHSSGWWKNPDYERCFHLSLSFFDPLTMQHAPRDVRLTKTWLEAFFGSNRKMLWCEPPYSPEGKRAEIWHYRLFCDQAWQPTVPRGEVYSRELTEAGWMSFSDVQASLEAAAIEAQEKGEVTT